MCRCGTSGYGNVAQHRLNYHHKPGGDTAGLTDSNQSNKTEYSILCAIMLGSDWGEVVGGKRVTTWEHTGHWAVRVALCISWFVLYILLISSIVVVTVRFICCSIKLPLYQPISFFAFFFPFSSPPERGEG